MKTKDNEALEGIRGLIGDATSVVSQ